MPLCNCVCVHERVTIKFISCSRSQQPPSMVIPAAIQTTLATPTMVSRHGFFGLLILIHFLFSLIAITIKLCTTYSSCKPQLSDEVSNAEALLFESGSSLSFPRSLPPSLPPSLPSSLPPLPPSLPSLPPECPSRGLSSHPQNPCWLHPDCGLFLLRRYPDQRKQFLPGHLPGGGHTGVGGCGVLNHSKHGKLAGRCLCQE